MSLTLGWHLEASVTKILRSYQSRKSWHDKWGGNKGRRIYFFSVLWATLLGNIDTFFSLYLLVKKSQVVDILLLLVFGPCFVA